MLCLLLFVSVLCVLAVVVRDYYFCFEMLLCVVCVFLCFLLFSSADRQSEIGDRKLESWTLGNVEDWRFFCLIPSDFYDFYYVYKNGMGYQRFCML